MTWTFEGGSGMSAHSKSLDSRISSRTMRSASGLTDEATFAAPPTLPLTERSYYTKIRRALGNAPSSTFHEMWTKAIIAPRSCRSTRSASPRGRFPSSTRTSTRRSGRFRTTSPASSSSSVAAATGRRTSPRSYKTVPLLSPYRRDQVVSGSIIGRTPDGARGGAKSPDKREKPRDCEDFSVIIPWRWEAELNRCTRICSPLTRRGFTGDFRRFPSFVPLLSPYGAFRDFALVF